MVGGVTLELAMRNKLGSSISPMMSDSVLPQLLTLMSPMIDWDWNM